MKTIGKGKRWEVSKDNCTTKRKEYKELLERKKI